MRLDPIILSALAMAVAFTMAFAGMKKHALESKRQKRVCPSCGRRIEGRTCSGH